MALVHEACLVDIKGLSGRPPCKRNLPAKLSVKHSTVQMIRLTTDADLTVLFLSPRHPHVFRLDDECCVERTKSGREI